MRHLLLLLIALLIACPGTKTSDDDDSATPEPCTDADDDGFCVEDDCDDSNPLINPDEEEVCDGLDNDCDASTEAAGGEGDADNDGSRTCADCDDADAANLPGGTEVCDGQDNDCDGDAEADEVDADMDGEMVCEGDCDDANPGEFSGNAEVCDDAADQDCDGQVDCADSECAAETICQPEDCENGVDDNADTLVDCDDPDCAAVTICVTDFDVVVVDDDGDVGKACAIALDGDDDPHLSYMEDDGDGDLKYAARDAGVWSVTKIDDGIFAGTSSSIRIASDDTPRIAYDQFGGLWYATWDGNAWGTEEASTYGGEDVSLQLAFDEPTVLHHDGDLLMIVEKTGNTWSANDNVAGSATAATQHFGELGFDGDFIQHVGFVDTNFYRARYGWNDPWSGGWVFEDVSTLDVIGGVSFVMEPFGAPHLVYGTLLTDELRYAVRTGTATWELETIASNTGSFIEVSMQVDSSGDPHIAWSDTNGQVVYTWHDGAQWNTQAVDDVGTTGGNPCLALNGNDEAQIGYYDADTGALKFASWSP